MSVAIALAALAGCGENTGFSPAGLAAASVRSKGMTPPRTPSAAGVGVSVATVTDERFVVILPFGTEGLDRLTVIPAAPVRVAHPKTPAVYLTTAAVEDTEGDDTVTKPVGDWTLVLQGRDPSIGEHIRDGIEGNVDDDGYPRLRSTADDVEVKGPAGVLLVLRADADVRRALLIEVTPSCARVGTKSQLRTHDLGGTWCVDRTYAVEVVSDDKNVVTALHKGVRVR